MSSVPEFESQSYDTSTDLVLMDGAAWVNVLVYEQERDAGQARERLDSRLGALGMLTYRRYFKSCVDDGASQQVASWPIRQRWPKDYDEVQVVVNTEETAYEAGASLRKLTSQTYFVDATHGYILGGEPRTAYRKAKEWIDVLDPVSKIVAMDGFVHVRHGGCGQLESDNLMQRCEDEAFGPSVRFDAAMRYKNAARGLLAYLNNINFATDHPSTPYKLVITESEKA